MEQFRAHRRRRPGGRAMALGRVRFPLPFFFSFFFFLFFCIAVVENVVPLGVRNGCVTSEYSAYLLPLIASGAPLLFSPFLSLFFFSAH